MERALAKQVLRLGWLRTHACGKMSAHCGRGLRAMSWLWSASAPEPAQLGTLSKKQAFAFLSFSVSRFVLCRLHLSSLSIGRRRHHDLDTTTVHAGASRLVTGGIPHDAGKPLASTSTLALRHQHRRGCSLRPIGHDLRAGCFGLGNSHHGFR